MGPVVGNFSVIWVQLSQRVWQCQYTQVQQLQQVPEMF